MKVAVCIPSSDTWKAMFAFQAFCLAVQSTAAGITLIPINNRSGDAAENRNRMTAMGLDFGADWFLFFDADMTFPPDTLLRLLRHNVDIVGADYRSRAYPFKKLGLNEENRPYPEDYVDPPSGLVRRGIIGLGCMLVRRAVFEKLPQPWFARTWIKEHASPDNPDGFATDDSYLCHYARHHGFDVWCDIDLTKEVCHIGEILIPWERAGNGNS